MLTRFIKKYSYNKEILVIKYDGVSKLNNYKVTLLDCDVVNYHDNYVYDLAIFSDYLEHMSDKDIEKTLRLLKRHAKEIIFDVAVSNYFCDEDHKDINYKKSIFYKQLFDKLGYVLIEEKKYRKNLFEKHSIFVICAK